MESEKCESCGTALHTGSVPNARFDDAGQMHDAMACRDILRVALSVANTRIADLDTELASSNQKRDQLFNATVSQTVHSANMEIAQQLGYERGVKAMQNAILEGVVAKPNNSAMALAFANRRIAEATPTARPASQASPPASKPPASASPRPASPDPSPPGHGRPSRPPARRGHPSGR